MPLTTESQRQTGYNEAANDLATALTELRNSSKDETVDIHLLVLRFNKLRVIRFGL